MATKKTPHADDIVEARRKEGFGPVSMYTTPNLTAPGQMIEAGHVVQMRFQEAVERDDFEAVGFEDLAPDYFAEKEA